MVTISSILQSLGSTVITALSPVFGIVSAPLTSVSTLLSSLGGSVSTVPSALPAAGLSGSTSFGIPPVEVLQPVLSTLGGVIEWFGLAALPVFSVFLTLIAVMASLIPFAAAWLVGVIVGIIAVIGLALIIGLTTGWFGFIITPTLLGLVLEPMAGFLIYGLGAALGMLVWAAMIGLLLPASGALSTPVMSFGNTLPIYFVNLMYLGILAPFVMLFNITLFTLPIFIPLILISEVLALVSNIPLWGFVIGDLGAFVIFLIVGLIDVIAQVLIGLPLSAIGTIVGLLLLEIPILLLAIGMTGSNSLIPGPTSIGNISGTVSATASDSVFSSLGSTGLTAAATVPVVSLGVGATAIMAFSTGSLASIGGMVLPPIGAASTGLLASITSMPGAVMAMLSVPAQAINASVGVVTGVTGMLTSIAGNRAIHTAIGILQ